MPAYRIADCAYITKERSSTGSCDGRDVQRMQAGCSNNANSLNTRAALRLPGVLGSGHNDAWDAAHRAVIADSVRGNGATLCIRRDQRIAAALIDIRTRPNGAIGVAAFG